VSLQYKNGTCTKCGKEDVPIVKKILPNKYCHLCNVIRLDTKRPLKLRKPLKRSPIKYKPRTTGEGVFLESIWASMPHVSWISQTPLGDEYNTMCMFHVLGKGAYPSFRLYSKNIILTTIQEHWDWHNISRDKLLEKDKRWQGVFDLEAELKAEYYYL